MTIIYLHGIVSYCRFGAVKQVSCIWSWKHDHWMDRLQLYVPSYYMLNFLRLYYQWYHLGLFLPIFANNNHIPSI